MSSAIPAVIPNINPPVPSSSVTADRRLALEGVARAVATPVPSPEMPVETGRPVAFVSVAAEGVPRSGVTREGEVAKTRAPEPVSSVTAEAMLALEGVARAVATPTPRPAMPVETGRPVAFVSVAAEGVPRFGVTRVGEVAKTREPEPVSSVTAEAAFELEGVARKVAMPVPRPETPVEIGSPVAFVSVAAEGVPRFGVTSVGEVAKTREPEPVSSEAAVAI
jgi:hypothetical protein